MHTAAFLFADGGEIDIPVAPGETVLEAAQRAGAPVRYDCTAGDCGACVVRLVAGATEVEPGPTPLSQAELALGLRATCRTRLRADVRFVAPYGLADAPPAPAKAAARVAMVARLSASVHRLRLELEQPEGFHFDAGQYVRLRPQGLRAARAFSMASAAGELPYLDFLIRHVPGGQVGSWLAERAENGARVALHGPLGGFALDRRARRHVFVAGGTGLAPVLSMLQALPEVAPAVLCFGCNTAEELFYEAELAELCARRPGLDLRLALLEGASGAIAAGHALSLVRGADLDADTACYLCGPPAMVQAGYAALQAAGVDPHRIRAERYRPAG